MQISFEISDIVIINFLGFARKLLAISKLNADFVIYISFPILYVDAEMFAS